MATPQQRVINNEAEEDYTRAVAQEEIRRQQKKAELSPHPTSLYELWVEYEFGIDNRKPAKEFTPSERGGKNKFKYCRRKNFWDLISLHVNAGSTSDAIIEKVYQCYGANLPVTSICELIRKDKSRRGHPNLRI